MVLADTFWTSSTAQIFIAGMTALIAGVNLGPTSVAVHP